MLTVELKAEGFRAVQVTVRTLGEAAVTCRRYISDLSLGASNWQGGIVRQDGRRKFWVSYNGRVWSYLPKGWATSTPEITGEELEIIQ